MYDGGGLFATGQVCLNEVEILNLEEIIFYFFDIMILKVDKYIELKPITMGYADDIFENFDTAVIKYLPLNEPPSKVEDTKAFVTHSIQQMEEGNDLVWVIKHREEFVGCCGIHDIKSRQPHFGLWIKSTSQGKGIGKKVVQNVLRWGISNLNVTYIKYPVDIRNSKSISLIKELGLKQGDRYEMGNLRKLDVIEYRLHKA